MGDKYVSTTESVGPPNNSRPSAANIRVSRRHDPPAGSAEPLEIAGWAPRKLEVRTFPDQAAGHGGPPPTIPNVKHLLDGNGVLARYNVIGKRTEVVIPGLAGAVDNEASVSIAHVKSLMALHGAIVDAIANENFYNPVAEWIGSRPWDGVNRLPDIYATLRTQADYLEELKHAIVYCWLLSAVAAALMPSGFSTRLVLTLQGPQSIGKTRWSMALVPDPKLRAAVLKTDHHFDGGNKDQIISAARKWIIELGELESSFRKDQERLKGILTRDSDIVRVPYAAADSEWPRRTVFMATVNGSDFLSDPTGSTRWGVVPVVSVDHEHGIDMQQLFAQLAVDFAAGARWWLTPERERQLEAWNERHQPASVVRDAVAAAVDLEGDDTAGTGRFTASELLVLAGVERPTQQQARECGGILRARFGPPTKIRGILKWQVPLRPGSGEGSYEAPPVAKPEVRRSKFD